MELPVTPDELKAWKESGAHAQDCLPHLSDAEREFLISGVTPEEWAMIPEEPDWDAEETTAPDQG